MSPEKLSDALNYLDDDLIEQTDELRQGKRVLHRTKVIRWVVPAACLALVLGSMALPAMNGGSKAAMDGNMEMAPGCMTQDSMNSIHAPENGCDCAESVEVQQVTGGNISLYIPENWTYTLENMDDGSYYIVIRNPDRAGTIRVGYAPFFGVCGTDLTEEEMILAGKRACKGTYGQSRYWSYIGFLGEWRDYVVINDGADGWLDTAMDILETIVIDEA